MSQAETQISEIKTKQEERNVFGMITELKERLL